METDDKPIDETGIEEAPEARPITTVPREPEPDAPEPDCPECKGGAPAWMATFADMATLLMAFFVLILSFAEMNVPKFKDVSGSMNDSFGVQRKVPVVEPPLSDSVIAKQFSQAKVDTTALSVIQEQTTNEPQPEDADLRTTTKPSDATLGSDIEKVRAALSEEIARGLVEVVQESEKISVITKASSNEGLESGEESTQRGRQLDQDTISLFAKVADAQTQVVSEIEIRDSSPSDIAESAQSEANAPAPPEDNIGDSDLEQIRQNLAPEISRSLVNVEMDQDQIKITLADQGAFVSGSADLRPEFLQLLSRVGDSISDTNGMVTVSGHTDSIPMAFSMRFKSNWDLSAARSASVADYLITQGYLGDTEVSVQGYADTVPIATNDTAEGRAKNRRIEIMIDKKG